MAINPNRELDWFKDYPNLPESEKNRAFPLFFCEISFDVFRHLEDLTLVFSSPVTVISGTNKSGKTTALMAIACSHYNFQRRKITSGDLVRSTWGDVIRFTDHDIQNRDWIYHVTYRRGSEVSRKQGSRNHISKKWSGVAKKQGQIDTPKTGNQAGRQVTLIDLERLQPARHLPSSIFQKAKSAPLSDVDNHVSDYLSYILEQDYTLKEICSSADNVIYQFANDSRYSSYNSASGEDVLTRLLRDIVDTPSNSLILIEEIEVGLHPKIQRRLMDVIRYESHHNKKQFIVTTHSQTILSSVGSESRLFIDKSQKRCIRNISSNAALSKMDAVAYPLVNLLVEDDLAKWIVSQVITKINSNLPGFAHLINTIIVGDANKTHAAYCFLREHFLDLRPRCGCICVLDGDQRNRVTADDGLFFLFGTESPEKGLLRAYLSSNPNDTLQYHLGGSNSHSIFLKMCELGICASIEEARQVCWNAFVGSDGGLQFVEELRVFLICSCKKYSGDL